MYRISAEAEFDSAHFLFGYVGGCANIHGHRWKVVCDVQSEKLKMEGPCAGMVMDFKVLKNALRTLAKQMDHKLIYERKTLKEKTIEALAEEGFDLIELPYRPTAENLACYFYDELEKMGISPERVTVYETPTNVACYSQVGE